jgi:hypothetical protein
MEPYTKSAMESFLNDTKLIKCIRSVIERQGHIPIQGDGVLASELQFTDGPRVFNFPSYIGISNFTLSQIFSSHLILYYLILFHLI